MNIEELLRDSSSEIKHLEKTVYENGQFVTKYKSLADINKEVFDVIVQSTHPSQHQQLCEKLIGYRLINELPELQKGYTVKVLRTKPPTKLEPYIQQMGIVLNIKFMNNGTHIVCLTPSRSIIQYKFNDVIATFQILSETEQMILTLCGQS
jgi:hypothetical protein